jgi:hypothetical protein
MANSIVTFNPQRFIDDALAFAAGYIGAISLDCQHPFTMAFAVILWRVSIAKWEG